MARVEGQYDIEAVRGEWIGRQTDVVPGRYPVEYDSIRRHCHMVEDTNPLFLDPEYGKESEWGAVDRSTGDDSILRRLRSLAAVL